MGGMKPVTIYTTSWCPYCSAARSLLRAKGVGMWLFGRSIIHIYVGPIDLVPPDETSPPTRDTDKIMGMPETKMRLDQHLLHRGVSTLHGSMLVLSSAHTEEDVDRTVEALAASVEAMVQEGSLA